MVSAAAITQVAFASWTATGCMSIPTTLSCNFFRVSVRDKPPEWLRMCSTARFDERPTSAGWIEHSLGEGGRQPRLSVISFANQRGV